MRRRVRCKGEQGHYSAKDPHFFWCAKGVGVCGYWLDDGTPCDEYGLVDDDYILSVPGFCPESGAEALSGLCDSKIGSRP
jgi:hypothetical protein